MEVTKLTCTHASLLGFMKRKYPWLENNFKYFSGKLEIPLINLNPKEKLK